MEAPGADSCHDVTTKLRPGSVEVGLPQRITWLRGEIARPVDVKQVGWSGPRS